MWLRFTIFLISFTALAFEILLTRLFSIIQWHHFAFMIISLALLGYGASGTFLSLGQRRFLNHWCRFFALNLFFYGLSILIGFGLAQSIPFNPLEILWDPKQFFYLSLIYLTLAFPFFFAANCIGLVLMRFKDQISDFYQYDLMGAGFGALGIIGGLYLFSPLVCLKGLSVLALLGVLISFLDRRMDFKWYWTGLPFAIILLVVFAWPHSMQDLKLSPYKGLSTALLVPDTEIIAEKTGPLGWITVVRSPTIPFRHAPGLSLQNLSEPSEQLAIFTDGDGLSPIHAFTGNLQEVQYLDFLSSALPYHLLNNPEVLILGGGGGSEILLAKLHGAKKIDVVELNRQVVNLLTEEFKDYSGGLFQDGAITPVVAEARSFVQRQKNKTPYDLIQISLLDSFGASTAGLYSLSENYLYTVEAMAEYLRLLKPDGLLAITRWIKLPARDSLKLLGTARAALDNMGKPQPAHHLALIRSWKTTTLLVKQSPFSPDDLKALKKFTEDRSFDLVIYPGMEEGEANQYNQLAQASFFGGAQALLGDSPEKFLNTYKFQIRPATDDRPFFFHFLKWDTLGELFALRDQGGLPLMEWGYPILLAILVQALLASLIFILLPILWLKKQQGVGRGRLGIFIYYFAIGLGFLFLEMAFLQKFILFLGHPLLAISVVLSGFLVFAGLGSGLSPRIGQGDCRTGVGWSVLGIFILGMIYQFLLPKIFQWGLVLPDTMRILISFALIAPLAFFMGMPFPLGLSFLGKKQPGAIPWAWGINGCASVLSTILAALLAIHLGFSMVIYFALGLYILAWLFSRQWQGLKGG